MDWTPEAIERLKALWAEGHSTAEIARRMGLSKNAVVGKVHRLNLPGRPSPIKRDGNAPPRPPKPKRQATSDGVIRSREPFVPPAPPELLAGLPAEEVSTFSLSAPPSVPESVFRRRVSNCRWPIGEPGQPGFRFCVSDAMSGKSYCPEHAAVAYIKRGTERREDAAD